MTQQYFKPDQEKIISKDSAEKSVDAPDQTNSEQELALQQNDFAKRISQALNKPANSELPNPPLTAEEITETFKEENLAKISLEEYIALLRRVPPRFITHVVRQGIRDHFSHHDAGVGKHHDGFKNVLKDGALHSILDQAIRANPTPESVKKILDNILHIKEEASGREEAEQMIYKFLTSSRLNTVRSSDFADKNAIHVAMDHVAGSYYGAETGNEIFVVFPTAFAASQYDMASQGMSFHQGLKLDSDSQTHQLNDFWLNRKSDGRGVLKLDAGIIFIAEDAMVDPRTGSKYALDKDNKPIRNEEQIEAIQKLAITLNQEGKLNNVEEKLTDYMKLRGKVLRQEAKIQELKEKGSYDSEKEAKLAASKIELEQAQKDLQPFLDQARSSGITDPRFFQILDASNKNSWSLDSFIKLCGNASRPNAFDKNNWEAQENLNSKLRGMGLLHKFAENPISSKQYWENYFQQTGKRPSKVVYYKGSPNEALIRFQRENGIEEKPGHIDLQEAFKDVSLHEQEHIQNKLEPQLREFYQIALDLLDSYFPAEHQ